MGLLNHSPEIDKSNLLAILDEVIRLVSLSGSNFIWTHWEDAAEALAELQSHRDRIAADDFNSLPLLSARFGPAGPLQELSILSGWAREFINLSGTFDQAAARLDLNSGNNPD
jgi:hypothetical protein